MTAPAKARTDARTPTDFGAIVGEDVGEATKSVRGNEIDKYPGIVDTVRKAYENGRAVLMPPRNVDPLPTADARKLARLLMQAADKLTAEGTRVGIAPRLVRDEKDGKFSVITETKDNPYTGKTARVKFQATERRDFDPDKPRRPTWGPRLSKAQFDAVWAKYLASVETWNGSHPDAKIVVADKPTGPAAQRGRKAQGR